MLAKSAAIADLALQAAAALKGSLYSLGDQLVVQPKTGPFGRDFLDPQPSDMYTELLKLEDLRKRGIITDAEFENQKKKLLSK